MRRRPRPFRLRRAGPPLRAALAAWLGVFLLLSHVLPALLLPARPLTVAAGQVQICGEAAAPAPGDQTPAHSGSGGQICPLCLPFALHGSLMPLAELVAPRPQAAAERLAQTRSPGPALIHPTAGAFARGPPAV